MQSSFRAESNDQYDPFEMEKGACTKAVKEYNDAKRTFKYKNIETFLQSFNEAIQAQQSQDRTTKVPLPAIKLNPLVKLLGSMGFARMKWWRTLVLKDTFEKVIRVEVEKQLYSPFHSEEQIVKLETEYNELVKSLFSRKEAEGLLFRSILQKQSQAFTEGSGYTTDGEEDESWEGTGSTTSKITGPGVTVTYFNSSGEEETDSELIGGPGDGSESVIGSIFDGDEELHQGPILFPSIAQPASVINEPPPGEVIPPTSVNILPKDTTKLSEKSRQSLRELKRKHIENLKEGDKEIDAIIRMHYQQITAKLSELKSLQVHELVHPLIQENSHLIRHLTQKLQSIPQGKLFSSKQPFLKEIEEIIQTIQELSEGLTAAENEFLISKQRINDKIHAIPGNIKDRILSALSLPNEIGEKFLNTQHALLQNLASKTTISTQDKEQFLSAIQRSKEECLQSLKESEDILKTRYDLLLNGWQEELNRFEGRANAFPETRQLWNSIKTDVDRENNLDSVPTRLRELKAELDKSQNSLGAIQNSFKDLQDSIKKEDLLTYAQKQPEGSTIRETILPLLKKIVDQRPPNSFEDFEGWLHEQHSLIQEGNEAIQAVMQHREISAKLAELKSLTVHHLITHFIREDSQLIRHLSQELNTISKEDLISGKNTLLGKIAETIQVIDELSEELTVAQEGFLEASKQIVKEINQISINTNHPDLIKYPKHPNNIEKQFQDKLIELFDKLISKTTINKEDKDQFISDMKNNMEKCLEDLRDFKAIVERRYQSINEWRSELESLKESANAFLGTWAQIKNDLDKENNLSQIPSLIRQLAEAVGNSQIYIRIINKQYEDLKRKIFDQKLIEYFESENPNTSVGEELLPQLEAIVKGPTEPEGNFEDWQRKQEAVLKSGEHAIAHTINHRKVFIALEEFKAQATQIHPILKSIVDTSLNKTINAFTHLLKKQKVGFFRSEKSQQLTDILQQERNFLSSFDSEIHRKLDLFQETVNRAKVQLTPNLRKHFIKESGLLHPNNIVSYLEEEITPIIKKLFTSKRSEEDVKKALVQVNETISALQGYLEKEIKLAHAKAHRDQVKEKIEQLKSDLEKIQYPDLKARLQKEIENFGFALNRYHDYIIKLENTSKKDEFQITEWGFSNLSRYINNTDDEAARIKRDIIDKNKELEKIRNQQLEELREQYIAPLTETISEVKKLIEQRKDEQRKDEQRKIPGRMYPDISEPIKTLERNLEKLKTVEKTLNSPNTWIKQPTSFLDTKLFGRMPYNLAQKHQVKTSKQTLDILKEFTNEIFEDIKKAVEKIQDSHRTL